MSNIICDVGRPGWPKVPTSEELSDWILRQRGDLTERQQAVLDLMADGSTDADIADALGISRRTVSAIVASVLDRLTPSDAVV